MYRHQQAFLKQWLNNKRRKPLIIRGARQVGKSTLVELFATEQSCRLMNVNLERYPSLAETFSSNDPQQILRALELLPKIPSYTDDALLFLDEIQSTSEAIPALRYFYEDKPELPVIAAGSLLEFTLANHSFSMPVGRVQYLHMGPMTFTEFLMAIGEQKLSDFILNYTLEATVPLVAHQRLLSLLRDYYFVGGMPEAVACFADTNSYRAVSEVHNSIIETYREDFPKYGAGRDLSRMLNVFNFAARNAGVKVKYSNISREEQSATLKKDLELLCMARVTSKVVHSHCSGLPLQASQDEKAYKLLFLDVGLMNAISGLNANTIQQIDEQKLINEGAIAEQFIGQHLQSLLCESPNRGLNYWLREGRASNAEVDYVIALSGKLVPIEIKAGASGSMRSLHQFMSEKSAPLAVRFDTALPSQSTVEVAVSRKGEFQALKYPLLSLPLYLIESLPKLIEQASHRTVC